MSYMGSGGGLANQCTLQATCAAHGLKAIGYRYHVGRRIPHKWRARTRWEHMEWNRKYLSKRVLHLGYACREAVWQRTQASTKTRERRKRREVQGSCGCCPCTSPVALGTGVGTTQVESRSRTYFWLPMGALKQAQPSCKHIQAHACRCREG